MTDARNPHTRPPNAAKVLVSGPSASAHAAQRRGRDRSRCHLRWRQDVFPQLFVHRFPPKTALPLPLQRPERFAANRPERRGRSRYRRPANQSEPQAFSFGRTAQVRPVRIASESTGCRPLRPLAARMLAAAATPTSRGRVCHCVRLAPALGRFSCRILINVLLSRKVVSFSRSAWSATHRLARQV